MDLTTCRERLPAAAAEMLNGNALDFIHDVRIVNHPTGAPASSPTASRRASQFADL
jgi:hypothetical protein